MTPALHAASWPPAAFAEPARLHFANDRVELAATLHCPDPGERQWALQLWADDSLLVAELVLGKLHPDLRDQVRVSGTAPLTPPAGQAARRLSLTLVSGRAGRWERLHERQRLALPHRFLQPGLEGSVRSELDGQDFVLELETVVNPRPAADLSGTLALELWAIDGHYGGGHWQGEPLGAVALDRLGGQQRWSGLRQPWRLPEARGRKRLTLMLREWTAAGYVTRDWRMLDWPDAAAGPLSINRATTAALRALPGLSDKLARTLVASRPFAAVEELRRVRGMNERLYAKLRDRVEL